MGIAVLLIAASELLMTLLEGRAMLLDAALLEAVLLAVLLLAIMLDEAILLDVSVVFSESGPVYADDESVDVVPPMP